MFFYPAMSGDVQGYTLNGSPFDWRADLVADDH
jgi:hypothetical protein